MMNEVSNEMQNAVPKDFDTSVNMAVNSDLSNLDPNYSTGFSGEFLVQTFKEALSGMSILIDGDKVGEFVTNQVEKVVFA